MPELPEVEVVKRSLNRKIQNLTIKKVKIYDRNLRYKLNKKKSLSLIGRKILKVDRKSKFLIFIMDKDVYMLVHLGMTGKFFFVDQQKKKYKTSFYYNLNKKKDQNHNRIIFTLNKNQKLIYNDVRKFGFIKFYNKESFKKNLHLKNLGPEPLNLSFNFNYLKKYFFKRKRAIKDILMDQKCVSGLGNIYANEILFSCGIIPTKKIHNLKDYEINKIIKNTKKILKYSIKKGGSTIKDFSSDDGKKGYFQQHFKVYGRKGMKCSNIDCRKIINRSVISNRATFFCSSCQK